MPREAMITFPGLLLRSKVYTSLHTNPLDLWDGLWTFWGRHETITYFLFAVTTWLRCPYGQYFVILTLCSQTSKNHPNSQPLLTHSGVLLSSSEWPRLILFRKCSLDVANMRAAACLALCPLLRHFPLRPGFYLPSQYICTGPSSDLLGVKYC